MSRIRLLILFFLCLEQYTNAQEWQSSIISPMPQAVANNAITGISIEGKQYLYSFAGIDSTKIYSGIHLDAWKYDFQEDSWSQIEDLPDEDPVIAAGASTIGDLIYIVGGYTVAANGSEVSSSKLSILDPSTDTYIGSDNDIPTPIDDHVQAVYRDSLLYIVTGWSNNGNVRDVQIYDTVLDQWSEGTPVPNESAYKVFGASGCIIGDTLYYAGGARYGANFPLTGTLKKGYIHPDDPGTIDWQIVEAPEALGYRMAAFDYEGKAYWLGGSQVSYNYDGIAYNGSGGVEALDRILEYDPSTGIFTEIYGKIPATMDLRGIAKLGANKFMIAGGMTDEQNVSNQSFLLTDTSITPTDTKMLDAALVKIHPNPALDQFWLEIEQADGLELRITDLQGRTLLLESIEQSRHIDISLLPKGLLICTLKGKQEQEVIKLLKLI